LESTEPLQVMGYVPTGLVSWPDPFCVAVVLHVGCVVNDPTASPLTKPLAVNVSAGIWPPYVTLVLWLVTVSALGFTV
jgi:hypothetical protein